MRRFAVSVLLVLAASTSAVWGTHPAEDPDGCAGSMGGLYLRHNHPPQIQVPRLGYGVIIPLLDGARGPFYVDVRDVLSEYWVYSVWLYMESNGQPGLQRGGRSPWPDTPVTDGTETCQESATPDRNLF